MTAFVTEYTRAIPDLRFSLVSAGLLDSIAALERGDLDVGMAFADAVYLASVSTPGPSKFRAITSLMDQPLYLLAGRDSGIARVADLRGHSVRTRSDLVGTTDPRFPIVFQVPFPDPRGPQLPREDPRSVSEIVLSAFGLDRHDVRSVSAMPEDAMAALKNGTLDASFVTTTSSIDGFREALEAGARIIPIDGPAIERLGRSYPLIRRVRVLPGTLPGQTRVVRTVGVNVVLVCRSDLDDAVAYRLAKAYVENVTRLAEREPLLRTARLEDAPVTPIPLHEGAARFYREWEMAR